MAFGGTLPTRKVVPATCGLLSVADVEKTSESNEQWVRGFQYEWETRPTVRVLGVTGASTTGFGGAINVAPDNQVNFADNEPFYIEVDDKRSMFDLPGEDRFARVLRQIEAATPKAIEREFWNGATAQAEANSNIYLTKTGVATIAHAGTHKPETALAHLEDSLSTSPVGEAGVIHMTRDVASLLWDRLVLHTDGNEPYITTLLGTPVSIGMGYTGNGPVGDVNAAASITNRWMFATGPVSVVIGESEIVNENLAQGANVTINDMRIKAFRPAAVYFDPSTVFTVRVDVSHA
jgi:hypothetical protein